MSDNADRPTVTAILTTYNWSNVLRFAIKSVLAQSFGDFELIVVGDCCTDDSEAVVRSFGDPRIQWHNLPQNCGSQFGPINKALSVARGRYIAYLCQDDLWHPEHLAIVVAAIEAEEADLVFSITEYIGPPAKPSRSLMGLAPAGVYEWSMWASPISWLYRRDLIDRVGPWRDYRTMVMPTDFEFFNRVFENGCRIVPVNELTAFKFPSIERTNSYVERRCDEQAAWWDRIRNEPDLRQRELIEVLKHIGMRHPDIVTRMNIPSRAMPGSMTAQYRVRRGLAAVPDRPVAKVDRTPLFDDRSMLRYLNVRNDIGPAEDTRILHESGEMPVDGLFIGLNWHSLESDEDGSRWRWIDSDAEIVVTRPSGTRRRLAIDLRAGPGIKGRSARLQIRNAAGEVVATAPIGRRRSLVKKLLGSAEQSSALLDLPIEAGQGAVFTLGTEDGGRTITGDPRILNFKIFGFGWNG